MKFCDRLVERFWSRCGFEIEWCEIPRTEERQTPNSAVEKAAAADLVVFALATQDQLPDPVQTWIEKWLDKRGQREGALADLIEQQSEHGGSQHVVLRSIAHRAGLDYLTDVPEELAHASLDSLESFSERAQQVTGVLESILHERRTRPRGLI